MTRYEQGFYKVAARYGSGHALGVSAGGVRQGKYGAGYLSGHGVNTAGFASPHISGNLNLSNAVVNNTLLGAGLGAAAGLGREAMKGDNERKHYLKSLLTFLLVGGATGLAATAVGNAPDMVDKIRKVGKK